MTVSWGDDTAVGAVAEVEVEVGFASVVECVNVGRFGFPKLPVMDVALCLRVIEG